MLTESGRIVELAKDCMWLDMEQRQLRCASCNGACGFAGRSSRCAAERRLRVPLPPGSAAALRSGQRVEIGLETAPLLVAALLSYLAPLLGFLSALMLAVHWLPAGSAEGWQLAVGLIGFAAGVVLARAGSHRRLATASPQLLRTLPPLVPSSSVGGTGDAPLASDR